MKKILLFALMVTITFVAVAQTETVKEFNTDIKSITVYLNSAEITRTQSITLAQGRNRVIFKNLSPKMDTRSIRVSTNENVAVLSISSKTDFLMHNNDKPRIKQLKDSVEILNILAHNLDAESDAYAQEEDLLIRNKNLGGSQSGVSVSEIKLAADYYRQRILEINKRQAELNREKQKNNSTLARLSDELNELNAKISYTRNEVTVLLSSPSVSTVDVELKYIVLQCGWVPSYDIRATDVSQPVRLEYRAKVFNNSDIDWNNIRMTLSTGDPNLSAAKPEMNPWYLNYQTYSYNSRTSGGIDLQSQGHYQNAYVDDLVLETSSTPPATGVGNYVEVQVSELAAQFEITEPYTIPSDDRPYLVDVSSHSLPATFKHFAVPKADQSVFLLAKITGWEDLNLMEGTANVYFGGAYIGQSYIQTRDVKDTLDLSLGRDPKILVTRTKLTDFSQTRFIGTKRKETFAYEMVIKNNRKSPIEIELWDQIPVSQDSEIEVETIEISNGQYDPVTGKIIWKYNVQPALTQKLQISFAIKYPKNKAVNVQQTKSRYMRTF